jgi:CheY-like chemotaxis protein
MFVSDALREEGNFRVIEAAYADEALTLLETAWDSVRVLITDVEMPGSMDGFTFTRVVRKAWPHIGLVVVSGRMRPDMVDLDGTGDLNCGLPEEALKIGLLGGEPP